MSRKKEKPANAKVPQRHPVAWKSALWPHLELIRSMRRGRKSFQAIADHLAAQHDILVTYRTVRNFLSRVSERAKKGRALPLGFEAHMPKPKSPTPLPSEPTLLKVTPESLMEDHQPEGAWGPRKLRKQNENPD
jgi:hypothetical protein